MLSVTFNEPIIIDAANLHSLLALANTPAVVAPAVPVSPVAAAPVKRQRSAASSAPTAAAGDAPKRKRATKAEMEARRAAETGGDAPKEEPKAEAPVVEPKAEAPVVEKPKRDRRSAAQKAAAAAKEAAKDAPKSEPSTKGKTNGAAKATANPDKLLERFALLIDSDFDKASGLLSEFGVKRFSELKAEQHGAFEAKLKEAGV